MGYEARWENGMYQVTFADTIEDALGTLMTITKHITKPISKANSNNLPS